MNYLLFTSIAALRNSSAMQSRVSQVENNLKKINPSWNNDWLFPAVAVGLSNSLDDVSWVTSYGRGVLAETSETINIDGVTISSSALYEKMGSDFTHVDSRADAQNKLDRVDAILSELAGKPVKWTSGLVVGAGTTAAPDLQKAVAEDTPTAEQTLADAAFDALNKLSSEDVLAVILRINTAKGALLKGAGGDEQKLFISALIGEEATATTA